MKGIAKFRKHGSSLLVSIPAPIRRELGLRPGEYALMVVDGDVLRVVQVNAEDLLKKVRENGGTKSV